jgi:hypothetical protein
MKCLIPQYREHIVAHPGGACRANACGFHLTKDIECSSKLRTCAECQAIERKR